MLGDMKTTRDSSEAKFAWWCYAIWWLDALTLLVIMIVVSAFRMVQDRRIEASKDDSEGQMSHSFAAQPSVI
jgi:hypothetical protein